MSVLDAIQFEDLQKKQDAKLEKLRQLALASVFKKPIKQPSAPVAVGTIGKNLHRSPLLSHGYRISTPSG
jgi:hypothetical protein